VRLGSLTTASAAVGGITSGFDIGASVTSRSFGGNVRISVLINAALLS
jgi:sulfate permease, SulP family